jgi:hypothetical protein
VSCVGFGTWRSQNLIFGRNGGVGEPKYVRQAQEATTDVARFDRRAEGERRPRAEHCLVVRALIDVDP